MLKPLWSFDWRVYFEAARVLIHPFRLRLPRRASFPVPRAVKFCLIAAHYRLIRYKHGIFPTATTGIISPVETSSLHYCAIINSNLMVYDAIALGPPHELHWKSR